MKILPQMRHARKYLDLLISNVKKNYQMNASLHLCLLVISFQKKNPNKINSNKLD